MCEIFKTCIHEAGHLFSLRFFGGDGYIEIFGNPTKTDLEKDVLGRVICTKQPSIEHQTRRVNAIVGLAGHCAELLNSNPDGDWLEYDLQDLWEFERDSISDTDQKLTEHAKADDFYDCAELIKQNYSDVRDIAIKHFIKAMQKKTPSFDGLNHVMRRCGKAPKIHYISHILCAKIVKEA